MPIVSELSEPVNILLVDDKPSNLIALAAILERPEYNLIQATSGKEALAKLKESQFAVLLLDVMMPQMDGFQLATLVKNDPGLQSVPIIFLTAAAHDLSYIYKAYSLGGVDYLQKPLDPNIVKAKVAVFVDLYLKNHKIHAQTERLIQAEHREQESRIADLKKQGETRYHQLTDAIPHIVWILKPDGTLQYCNQRWFNYSGLTMEESRNFLNNESVFHPEDRTIFKEKWQKHIAKGENELEIECRLKRRSDSSFRWHLCRALPERNADGKITAWLGTFTDIDQQKLAEEELKFTRQLAEEANQAKSQFLANMSHEIRTPLGAILGFAELILLGGETSAVERTNWIQTIKRNCQHLSRLIDEILDLSKVEAGQLEVERREFAISDLLTEVQSVLQQQVSAKNLYLNMDISQLSALKIISDPDRLRQILTNVIGNAVKFTEKGGVTVLASMNKVKDRNILTFAIKDTGPGLTEEQGERLFQPFMQADKSTSRRYGGTGLGLAIARRLARALGGDLVLAESSPSIGSTFSLTIEVATKSVKALPTKAQGAVVAQAKPPGRPLVGLHILLVEDTLDNQVLIRRFLESDGATVELAQNGLDGVEKATAGAHDLILMDVQMPELDGYRATAKLREQGYVKPIVALTAHVMKGERERCLKAGYTDYLSKPINRQKLVETLAGLRDEQSSAAANLQKAGVFKVTEANKRIEIPG